MDKYIHIEYAGQKECVKIENPAEINFESFLNCGKLVFVNRMFQRSSQCQFISSFTSCKDVPR